MECAEDVSCQWIQPEAVCVKRQVKIGVRQAALAKTGDTIWSVEQ
jgi:hypothetical protein